MKKHRTKVLCCSVCKAQWCIDIQDGNYRHMPSLCCYPASEFLCFGSQDDLALMLFSEPPTFRPADPPL